MAKIRKKMLAMNVGGGEMPGFFLFGGLNEDGQATNTLFFIHFDIAANKEIIQKGEYVKAAPLKLTAKKFTNATGKPPCPRYAHGAAVFGNYFVVFGGRNNKLYSSEMKNLALNDLHLFDFHKEMWVTVAMFGDLPCTRWSPTLVSSSDKLILLGGMNLAHYCNNAVFELTFS